MNSFAKNFFSSALGAFLGVVVAIVGIFVIVPVLVAFVFLGVRHVKMEGIKPNSILHLEVRGQIVEKHRPMDFEIFGDRSIFTEDRTLGLYELNKAIDFAKDDKRIKGIYLDLQEFNAGWATLTALRRHIEDFKKSGKWVYAYGAHMDEMGYYLASVANQIYLEPFGELEFNGLVIQEMFFKGLLDKLELEPKIFRVGRFKAAVEPLIRDKMSDENREQTQALIGDIWQMVREAAAGVTKQSVERIDQMANGLEIVSAEAAKSATLISDTRFADAVEDEMRDLTVGKDNELQLVTAGQMLRENKDKKRAGKKIAVVFAEGEIHFGDSGRDSIGSESFREDILDAKADDDVAAIVVRINSPGGDALASDVIWRELRSSDDELPVVISMGDMAASGGYYMAAAGRYIFAEPTTITGSIGVFGVMFNSEKFFKSKAGVSFDRAATHAHADIGSMARPMSDFEARIIQDQVERTYKRFLDVVQDGRGYEQRSDIESIAEGRVWSGARAKELGLVDELGGLDQAIAKAAEFAEIKDYQIEIFPTDTDPFKHLLERFGGEAATRIFGVDLSHVRAFARFLRPISSALKEPMKSGVYARLPFDFKIH